MSRASAARRLAAAAAYGGGGLGVLGGALYAVLLAEASIARRAIGPAEQAPPDSSGLYGSWFGGDEISMVVLGDSAAAGYGVSHVRHTTGALLANGLSEVARRPVRLTSAAFVGAVSADLDPQVDRVLATQPRPGVAAVIIGVNDVTHRVRPSDSVRMLEAAVRRLRQEGCAVVVGTCPDLGTVRPIAPPLRQLARLWSRRLAAAQTIAVVEAGGRTVSLATILGPEFDAAPAELFGPDRYHPSEAGYASLAGAILPSLVSAAGLMSSEDEVPEGLRGDGVLPISFAAAEAARTPGTEVARTQVAGRERGPRGRWVLLRHRQRWIRGGADRQDASTATPSDGGVV